MILFLLPALGFSGSMTSGGVALYTLPFCSASSRFNSQSLTFSTSSPNPSASANACKNQSYLNTNTQSDLKIKKKLNSIYPQCKIHLQNRLLKQGDVTMYAILIFKKYSHLQFGKCVDQISFPMPSILVLGQSTDDLHTF